MNLNNVKLILAREIRDQLRDRRTLFMIVVLPLLLYPLLGATFFQLSQFLREHPTRVLVVGDRELSKADSPPQLFNPEKPARFADGVFARPGAAELISVTHAADESPAGDETAKEAWAREQMLEGSYDALIYFPPDFAPRLEQFRAALRSRDDGKGKDGKHKPAAPPEIPNPRIYYHTAREASQVAQARLEGVLERWSAQVGERNLLESNVPTEAARPFLTKSSDVADKTHRDAALWSKILPFILVLWTLTGAFYPAVDLCAGEKERGTLETLLCSPARRSEIVVGKLLTVMLFSMATAVLNLASMGITGLLVVSNMQQMAKLATLGMPPASAILWLGIALIPVSALFSALSVSLAAFARSTKEGQYYLMPLILLSMPLVMLTMTPAIKLSLGTSLIPVTGLMLLLRELLQGNYAFALLHAAPVIAVTLVGVLLAVRWAIEQFNSEAVLFRESERFDLAAWLRHVIRNRQPTPTVAMGVMCGLLLLVIRFFSSLLIPQPTNSSDFLTLQAFSLVAFIAVPALIMTFALTRSPRATLLLRRPPLLSVPLAVLLAMALHPVVLSLHRVLAWLYPVEAFNAEVFEGWLRDASLIQILFVFALLPAVCEELAFRGFILSGLRSQGHTVRAVVISSIFFGVIHMLLQQSIGAVIVGLVIGVIAVRTGSLWPCILFHFTHNALTFTMGEWTKWTPVAGLFERSGDDFHYAPAVVAIGAIAAGTILWRLWRSHDESRRGEPDAPLTHYSRVAAH